MKLPLDIPAKYLQNGWSVLPVKPEEKRPYMQNWLQYTHTRPTAELVNSWFSNLAGAGVGVATGKVSNMVVLDVESTCPYSIDDLLKQYPTQLISRTGSGGYHLFYQYPNGSGRIANRVRLFDGVDLRADGGFIVLPPTVHPNGNRYAWVSEGVPGAFPSALLDIKPQAKTTDSGWITEALRGVTEGGRNDACARLCGYFFSKGMPLEIVESLIFDWNERNDPPLPVNEVRTTIASIERSHTNLQPQQFTGIEYDAGEVKKDVHNSTFDLMKYGDYIRGYGYEGVSWLVDEWLPDKSITFMISPPESYKTWILLDLAVSVATGRPFLGQYKINGSGPALIIQQEDSHNEITDRLALITEVKMGSDVVLSSGEWQIPCVPDIPVYVHPSRLLRFDNPKVLMELEVQIAELRPKVVLIDPLYSTTSTDNYMASSAEQMMILKTWRDKYGCSFIIAHHSKKNVDPDSTAREDSWGSQFLNAFLEAGWQIRHSPKLAQNEVVVRRHSKVMGNQPLIMLTFDIHTVYPMRYNVTSKTYESSTGTTVSQPAQANLLDLFDGRELSQKDIVGRTGKAASTISRQIKQLESAGLIEKMPSGRFRVKGG